LLWLKEIVVYIWSCIHNYKCGFSDTHFRARTNARFDLMHTSHDMNLILTVSDLTQNSKTQNNNIYLLLGMYVYILPYLFIHETCFEYQRFLYVPILFSLKKISLYISIQVYWFLLVPTIIFCLSAVLTIKLVVNGLNFYHFSNHWSLVKFF